LKAQYNQQRNNSFAEVITGQNQIDPQNWLNTGFNSTPPRSITSRVETRSRIWNQKIAAIMASLKPDLIARMAIRKDDVSR
jgi:hypothetical protein